MTTTKSTVLAQSSVRETRWQAVWEALTRPAAAIQNPEERRRARLLSAMLLLLAIIFALIVFCSEPYMAARAGVDILSLPMFFIDIGYMLSLFGAYALARTRYLLGGHIALAASFISLYASVVFLPDFVRYETVIVYLIVQFTIASFFLTIRQMIALAGVYLTTTTLIALLVPGVTFIDYLTPMPFIVMMLALSLIFMRYRDNQEQARQNELALALHRTELLKETSQFISSTLELEDVLGRIAEQMCRAVDTTSAYICDFQEGVMAATVVAEYISPAACKAESVSDLGATYDDREFLGSEFMEAMCQGQIDSAHIDDPNLSEADRKHMQQYNARTILYIPLRVQGQLIGYTELWESRRRREYSPGELALCQGIAQQAAFALQNAQLHRQLQTHAAELERRVAERTDELERANRQLRLASAVKDEFVASISHELKTPLTNIKLYLNLMNLKPEENPRYLSIINREAERLRSLIEDVLFLSELDRAETPPLFTRCDLNTLVETFVMDRIPLAAEQGLSLEFKPSADLLPVKVDRPGFENALSNLVTNALNYTPSGGKVVVSTGQRLDEDQIPWIVLNVQDTGPGIDADEMARLFERFFRGKLALLTGTPGTGLGLSIVKDIVERHNGRVEVSQNPDHNHGARFTLWLPPASTQEPVDSPG